MLFYHISIDDSTIADEISNIIHDCYNDMQIPISKITDRDLHRQNICHHLTA
ncbi:hypothetical protein B0I21_10971 [Sphingobacterium paludis]|uniref:Uncharacterized protein n=1 Tax=Sphingobacterium paludis TaxID=1476465 RepID=A0A4R7CVP0_9SPHI|nr:hypothetical protein B0I21_10971 [Sphingobacterium paludis]